MAKRNVDLTSKAWRDLVFEGKNKEFGAYDLRQKSEKRHTLAVIFTLIGLAVVAVLVIGLNKWNAYQEELRLQEERERMSQAMYEQQDMEEVPEEEEEEIVKQPEEEKKPEVVEEVVETVQQTAIEIVKEEEVKNPPATMEEKLNETRVVSTVTQEGTTTDVDAGKVFKEEVTHVEEPKPVEIKKEPEPAPKEEKVETPPPPKAPDEVFTAVEQMPEFPGGQQKLMQWLSSNLRYPDIAQQNGVQGRVIVKFVVEKDGSITGVEVAKGVDKDLDAEAVRTVKRMPKWQPGKNNGQAVRTAFTLPVQFKLQNQ